MCRGHPDPNQWPSRVVLPEDGKISVSAEGKTRLVLAELLPNQQYFLKVELHLMVEGGRDEVRNGTFVANLWTRSAVTTEFLSIHL